MNCFRDNKQVEKATITNLKLMLDDNNRHAKAFRMIRDILKNNAFQDLKLRLISGRSTNGCVYNHPTVQRET
ncbi:unnamed protein product [Lathyrus sativus]|nr:unnamed protein product [Lathyrus sativus]